MLCTTLRRHARHLLFATAIAIASLVAYQAPAAATSTFQEYSAEPQLSGQHADVLRLYWAFFDREPDLPGSQYWVGQYDQCATLLDITYSFGVSPEFQAAYGAITDAEFLDLIYGNVLDRAPDPSGRSYWAGLLQSGDLIRAEVMLYFSLSEEFRGNRPLPSDGRPYGGCNTVAPAEPSSTAPSECHTAYTPCLPPGADLDCGDIGQRVTVKQPGNDPYNLDRDNDGIGCESYG